MIKISFVKENRDETLPLEIKCLHDSTLIGIRSSATTLNLDLERDGGLFELGVQSDEPLFIFSNGLILPVIFDAMYACSGSEQLRRILSKKSFDHIFASIESYTGFEFAFLVISMSYGDEIVIASRNPELVITEVRCN